jgi:hypothetical protein
MKILYNSNADLELETASLVMTIFRSKRLAIIEDYQNGGFMLHFYETDEELRHQIAHTMCDPSWRISRGELFGIEQCHTCDNFCPEEQMRYADELTPLCPECYVLFAPQAAYG